MQQPPAVPPSHEARDGVDRAAALRRWEQERARGRTTFVVRRGVIGWGLPAAFLAIAYKALQVRELTTSLMLSHDLRVAAMVALVVFPFCGFLFGHWLWRTGEERYDALKRESGRGRGP